MPKFTFQLDSVLRHRAGLERVRQGELAIAERERAAAEGRVRELMRRAADEQRELGEGLHGATGGPGSGAIGLRGVRWQSNHILSLGLAIRRDAIRLAGLETRRESARRALADATTAKRALETLRERRHAEWRDTERRREESAADDLNTARAWADSAERPMEHDEVRT